jgi:hypothetical protein
MNPRVWVGKNPGSCKLIVDCPECGKPAHVQEPDAAQTSDRGGKHVITCLTGCKKTRQARIPVATECWAQHKTRCVGH